MVVLRMLHEQLGPRGLHALGSRVHRRGNRVLGCLRRMLRGIKRNWFNSQRVLQIKMKVLMEI